MQDPPDPFHELVGRLHAGENVPQERIGQVLAKSGRDWRELVGALVSGRRPRPGDRCPCGGRIRVRTSKTIGQFRLQTLDCGTCRRGHGRRTVPV